MTIETSEFTIRIHQALASQNIICPNLEFFADKNAVTFRTATSDTRRRYSNQQFNTATVYNPNDRDRKDINSWVKIIGKSISKWNQTERNYSCVSTLDAFFDIKGHGVIERPVEVDKILLNILEAGGHSVEQLVADMYHDLHQKNARETQIYDILASCFTNRPVKHMRNYFHVVYRRLTELSSRYHDILPFQGPVWGPAAHFMAFDIHLAPNIHYRSSVSPTITMRGQDIPESMLASLKGRPINDLLDQKLFGESVTIKYAGKNKNVVNLTLDPDRVDITHLGRQAYQLQRKAA